MIPACVCVCMRVCIHVILHNTVMIDHPLSRSGEMCEKRIFITVAVERQLFPSQSVPKVVGLIMRLFHFMVMFQSAAVGSTYAGDAGDHRYSQLCNYFKLSSIFFPQHLTFQFIQISS